jgi:hypothetical protein
VVEDEEQEQNGTRDVTKTLAVLGMLDGQEGTPEDASAKELMKQFQQNVENSGVQCRNWLGHENCQTDWQQPLQLPGMRLISRT